MCTFDSFCVLSLFLAENENLLAVSGNFGNLLLECEGEMLIGVKVTLASGASIRASEHHRASEHPAQKQQ